MGKRLKKISEKIMRRNIFIILLYVLTTNALCQSVATYSYKRTMPADSEKWYSANMCLMENEVFIFSGEWRYGACNVSGNWHLRNDSILVLNSIPQKTRFMVREEYITRKHKRNYAKFKVLDDSLCKTSYYLYTISAKGDTTRTWVDGGDCYMKNNFESFYIERYNGKSPTYKRKSNRNNDYLVLFPGGYIFEGEEWIYNKEYLIPLEKDGKYANYKLTYQGER